MNNIELCRKQMDMSVIELAKSVGVTRTYIYDLQKGIKIPSVHLAFALADTLGVNVEYLFKK